MSAVMSARASTGLGAIALGALAVGLIASRSNRSAARASAARTLNHDADARVSRAPRLSRAANARVSAARRLNRAAGALALSVLTDSAMEHYRGAFHNRAMMAPLLSASLSVIASAHGSTDPRGSRHRPRTGVYALAIATGLAGTAFHVYNITKRTGGVSAQNVFYGAPIGAPAALILSGLLGGAAEHVRSSSPESRLAGMPAGKALSLLTSVGLAGTAGEAGLLHFRGAYHNPAMYAPVSVPPLAAALLARSALIRSPSAWRWARRLLRVTAALGFVGAGFHAYGVSRNMGGFRNWTQNLFNGPPLPAPPSFTALALAGLAALDLQRADP